LSAARKTDKNCGDCGTCIEISPVINFTVSRRPTLQENSPTKVGAQVLRHQLRTKVRSMDCFRLCHQLRVKTHRMSCFLGYGIKLRTKTCSM
jgi:hypothetical protein